MLKKKILKVLAVSLSMLVTFSVANTAFAASNERLSLAPYEEKLKDLNTELGTDYKIQPEAGQTTAELAAFYTSMSVEKFEAYIREAHEAALISEKQKPYVVTEIIDSKDSRATIRVSRQKFYYNGGPHYLGFETEVHTSGGTVFYDRYIETGFTSGSPYPYLKPISTTYSFSADYRKASCLFKCSRYIANGIADAAYKNVSCTFTAGVDSYYPGA